MAIGAHLGPAEANVNLPAPSKPLPPLSTLRLSNTGAGRPRPAQAPETDAEAKRTEGLGGEGGGRFAEMGGVVERLEVGGRREDDPLRPKTA